MHLSMYSQFSLFCHHYLSNLSPSLGKSSFFSAVAHLSAQGVAVLRQVVNNAQVLLASFFQWKEILFKMNLFKLPGCSGFTSRLRLEKSKLLVL